MEDQASFDGQNARDPFGKRRRFSKWLVLIVVVAAAAGGYYWYTQTDRGPQDQPLIVDVVIGDVENTIATSGTLEPIRVVDVGAQVSGQLLKLYVDAGDAVTQGQLLAEIDDRVQTNRVESARASLAQQEAQLAVRKSALELAKINFRRQERLWQENATSELDYQNAQNNLISAEANLVQIEKQIEQSQFTLETELTNLEFTKIYAPIDGIVASIAANEGVTLNANQSAPTIMKLANLSEMLVKTEISEADIGKVQIGMEVYFTTLGSGERRYYSQLDRILPEPTVNNNVVTYTGEFTIENDGTLHSQMTTQVYFVTAQARNVVTVPVGALTFVDGAAGAAGQAGAGGMSGRMSGGGLPNGMSREQMAERMAQFRAQNGGGRMPPEGFSFGESGPGGYPGFAGRDPAAGFAGRPGGVTGGVDGESAPRRATVKVANEDGTLTEREVTIGVMSRVSAEVISGLEPGERVVAGILQADAPAPTQNNNNNQWRGGMGGPPFMRF